LTANFRRLAHKAFLINAAIAASFAAALSASQKQQIPHPGKIPGTPAMLLHNGWKITPAGKQVGAYGDLLMGGVVSPNRKWIAFVNAGAADHNVILCDANSGELISRKSVPRAQSANGLVFSSDSKTLYVSGANAGRIYRYSVSSDGMLTAEQSIAVPGLQTVFGKTPDPGTDAGRDPARQDKTEDRSYLAGIALSPDGSKLYIANTAADALYSIEIETGKLLKVKRFDSYTRPGAIQISPDGNRLYVALLGSATVAVLDATDLSVRSTVHTGRHPNCLIQNTSGSRLFVSCGNDDTVCGIDTKSLEVTDVVDVRLFAGAPSGSTPSSLSLSPDENTLYAACSDNNTIACIRVSPAASAAVTGFIPTDWYPTMLAASPDGKHLLTGSGKGAPVGPNDKKRPINPAAPAGSPYIVSLLQGIVRCVDLPQPDALKTLTAQALANSKYQPQSAPRAASAKQTQGMAQYPIKHVLYIIKENRTYDQVLGDLKTASGKPLGNGDPELCLFGEDVTPNHHALAREFVTLDNFYADGEVSVDGHHWSNGAYVPETMQRTWPSEYGGKGGTPIRYGDFGDPLAETPNGRLWDLCERAHIPYRTYYYHVDKHKSEEWSVARHSNVRDYLAADIFVRDVERWSKENSMPGFMVMALSEDHTAGTRAGAYTPKAAVASNDLALGKIVEACSKSPFWKNLAIFVVEDDAQNGPDHVDAHRTVALAISPYIKHHTVDSTMYSTCSLLRTMENILGLPQMSQFDAAAAPLIRSFTARPDFAPYACRTPKTDIQARNTTASFGAAASARLDFSEPDRLTAKDEQTLNRVLWHSIKGQSTPYPAVHTSRKAVRDSDD
jgi:YVTN family beta-propeller protein